MSISTVFTNNRTQAVRLPADMRLPEDVKQVTVRAKGKERTPRSVGFSAFFEVSVSPRPTLSYTLV